MLLDEVKTRLALTMPDLAGRIEGAAEMAQMMAQGSLPTETPFAFVIPLALDGAQVIDATGVHMQATTETIGVVLIVEYAGDPSGAQALPDLVTLRDGVIQALAGWQPQGAIDCFQLRRARLLDLKAATVFYQIDFSIPGILRV